MHVKTLCVRLSNTLARAAVVLFGAAMVMASVPATAQESADPNPGALTFTGGIDVLPGTAYVFRGITQESDPKLTLWPYGDIGIALHSGEGSVKTVGVNFGVWNSLHTGSSGLDGANDALHYEEDFYATLALGLSRGVSLGTTFTAYTSPNFGFHTVQELSFKVSKTHMLSPYGILAFELGDGEADGGSKKGTYLELGVGPSWPLADGKATVTIPVKLGMSLHNYYENPLTGKDEKFGFFDVGALLTVPIAKVPASFGAWNFHVGGDVLLFGDTTEVFNSGDNVKGVFLFGIGVGY